METVKLKENTTKNTHKKVAQLITEEGQSLKIVDIPCGEGAFTSRLRKAGLNVYSSDAVNMIKIKDAHFIQSDMNERLSFDDGAIDAIASIDGIEHIERPFDFIKECRRILRQGGSIVISTPNISSLRSRWRWFTTGFHNKCKNPLNENAPNYLHHINMISYPELRYMLHSNGFKINKITTNRMKAANLMFAPLVPVIFMATFVSLIFKREKDAELSINRTVMRDMLTPSLLFGETMIVRASALDTPKNRV